MIYDYCVIGGGIVGLATAMKLLELRPGASLLLLEKEAGWQDIRRDTTAASSTLESIMRREV